MKDNVFVNNSSDINLSVVVKSENKELWNIEGNRFKNFNSIMRFGKNAGHINISNNDFSDSSTAIEIANIDAGTNVSLAIKNNSFFNISSVYKDLCKKVYLSSFEGNIVKNSSIDLDINLLKENTVINSNAIYSDKVKLENIINGVQKTIFPINDWDYRILCWVEITSGYANRVKDLVRFSRHKMSASVYNVKVEVLSHQSSGNYPIPFYSVDSNGLNSIITGAGGYNFNANISVIDIKN